ncbi:hypothetical protein ABY45_16395 [Microbacterium maritypicum]|uniref:hypothetical protein n=1 Tax=Microbacterium maritypicum TaxID=33918 RepID=UPI003D6E885B
MSLSTKITMAVVAAVVVVGAGVAVWVLQPQSGDSEASAAPQPPPTQGEVDELDSRLASGDSDSVASALGMLADEVTEDVVAGFQGLNIDWDSANITEVSSGAWAIPATVAGPDGTESAWSVTLVRSEDGLVFADSVALP